MSKKRVELYCKLIDITKTLKLDNMLNNRAVNNLCIVENNLNQLVLNEKIDE